MELRGIHGAASGYDGDNQPPSPLFHWLPRRDNAHLFFFFFLQKTPLAITSISESAHREICSYASCITVGYFSQLEKKGSAASSNSGSTDYRTESTEQRTDQFARYSQERSLHYLLFASLCHQQRSAVGRSTEYRQWSVSEAVKRSAACCLLAAMTITNSDLFVTWSYVHPYSCRVLQLNSPWSSPAKRWFDPWEVPDIRNVPKDSKLKRPASLS
ncbi:hypothetical protein DTO271G3_4078 [Paecilomyces variotii]|nr:hypothetical protein DTO271G3_4078 [Paecilomyces variotii]